MKVNLLIKGDEPLAGYLNMNPFTERLDDNADDAELEELRAIDVVSYFPASESEAILDHWVKKLAHKGRIIIGFIDLIELAKWVSRYKMGVDEANLFLYGEQQEEWQFKKTIFTTEQVVTYLESKGLVILRKRVDDCRAVVEAQRP